jgi:type II secretory pathway pseudopilin PulG
MVVVSIIGLLLVILVPWFFKAREESTKRICIESLVQMYQAKVRWALDNRRLPTDVPTDADLFGTNAYMRLKPSCPSGGAYTLNQVDTQPTCDYAGHSVP